MEGLWQGYQLPREASGRLKEGRDVMGEWKLPEEILSPSKDDASASKHWESKTTITVAEWSEAAQSGLELVVESCELIGGPVGQQRFLVIGSAREGDIRYKVGGFIQQVGMRKRMVRTNFGVSAKKPAFPRWIAFQPCREPAEHSGHYRKAWKRIQITVRIQKKRGPLFK